MKPLVLRAGRIVPATDGLWLEAFAGHAEELVAHLKKHAFRKHLLIDDISDSIDTLLVYVAPPQQSPEVQVRDRASRGRVYREIFEEGERRHP